jgi:hypothetical protein
MSRDAIPKSDRLLPAFADNLNTKVNAVTGKYTVSEALAAQMQVDLDSYIMALDVAQDPATRTLSSIATKNQNKANLIGTLRTVVRILQANPDVNDSIRRDMGLPVPKTPAPIPAPATAPSLDVMSVAGASVRLKVHDGADLRGKPAGVAEARIFSYVGDNAPQSDEDWHFEAAATRTSKSINVTGAVAGKLVWLRACWVNEKAQAGPFCTPISTAVQLATPGATSGARQETIAGVAGEIRKAA